MGMEGIWKTMWISGSVFARPERTDAAGTVMSSVLHGVIHIYATSGVRRIVPGIMIVKKPLDIRP